MKSTIMPTLIELRQRAASGNTLMSRTIPDSHFESLVSDRRSQMTPKQMVESKLGQALAAATQRALANGREQ